MTNEQGVCIANEEASNGTLWMRAKTSFIFHVSMKNDLILC